MAILHIHFNAIRRSKGSSAVAAAAYRSGARLFDERRRRHYDFTKRTDVAHSEIMAPPGVIDAFKTRQSLWNAVEARETRSNAVVARELELSLPVELAFRENLDLVRDFVGHEILDRGLIADVNVHWKVGKAGVVNPHVHILATDRPVLPSEPDGCLDRFGLKDTRLWRFADLYRKRESWAEHLNASLAEHGFERFVDHRSFKAQGIELEAGIKIGAAAARRRSKGDASDRVDEHQDIAARNVDLILSKPVLALNLFTRSQASFTREALLNYIKRRSENIEQAELALAAVMSSPELLFLGKDGEGAPRYTSRDMAILEGDLRRTASIMSRRSRVAPHGSGLTAPDGERVGANDEPSPSMAALQDGAHLHILIATKGPQRDALLKQASLAWASGGRRVQALAATEPRANALERETGLPTVTLSAFQRPWRGYWPAEGDRLIVDQSGLLPTLRLHAILTQAHSAGASVVLLAEPHELRRTEVGAPLRALLETLQPIRLEGSDLTLRAGAPVGGCPLETARAASPVAGLDPDVTDFARRRQINPAPLKDVRRNLEHASGRAGLTLETAAERMAHRTIRGYARAALAVRDNLHRGRLPSQPQRNALSRASSRLQALWPQGPRALEGAFARDLDLIQRAANGGTTPLVRLLHDLTPCLPDRLPALLDRGDPTQRRQGLERS